MDLTFNIIYTKGTVNQLLPFLYTLLEHTDSCSFRLVDNGCEDKESQVLEYLCQQNDRLKFYSLNVDNVLEHGKVLNHLQSIEKSDYFAFMDSDIFAIGPFLSEHLKALESHAGICACLPVWWDSATETEMQKEFVIMGGEYLNSHNHIFLGVSYYAIYHNYIIRDLIESDDITFQRYTWNQVPRRHQETLIQLGLKKNIYDTSKLLNIFLQRRGGQLIYLNTPSLYHIGGLSRINFQTHLIYYFLRSVLIRHTHSRWRRYLRALRHQDYRNLSEEECAVDDLRTLRTQETVKYLYSLLKTSSNLYSENYLNNFPYLMRANIQEMGKRFLEIYDNQFKIIRELGNP